MAADLAGLLDIEPLLQRTDNQSNHARHRRAMELFTAAKERRRVGERADRLKAAGNKLMWRNDPMSQTRIQKD
jgi:hypothetical protein